MMLDLIWDTALDTVRVLPFLFVTYLLMEYLERRMEGHAGRWMAKAGLLGPLVGAATGVVPQCGFSAAAASLYAGRVISLGTLMAVFLSTSDEMLPILLSERAPAAEILKILGLKVLIGAVLGLVIDFVLRRRVTGEDDIGSMCSDEHCHCEEGSILRAAAYHTLQVSLFLLAISFALNVALFFIGEDALAAVMLDRPVLGVFLAGLVGLIPNCASSVAITTLYLEGLLGFGAMMAGLLVGAGVGLLVLFRTRRGQWRRNFGVVGLLYGCGVVCGLVLDTLHFVV